MDLMKIIIEVEAVGVGSALKAAREDAKISLTVAGDRSGMSGANFNRIENEDNKGVPIQTLVRAANAVGLDLTLVLGDWIKYIPDIEIGEAGDRDE